jgi:hypothetical protein
MRKHGEKTLVKYKTLLMTKINSFTRQINLKTLLNDANIVNFEIIFYDKSMKPLYSNSTYKINTFDTSASICWSNFDDLVSTDLVKQIEFMRIYAKISLFLQISNKVLKPFSTVSNSKANTLTKRSLINEYKFNLKNFDTNENLFTNSMIKLYLCDKNLITGIWNSNDSSVKSIAFITFNLFYTSNLVNLIFDHVEFDDAKIKSFNRKSNLKDLELDSKFGLHDYFVYFSFRNQTSSVFLTHMVDIYKTRFDYCNILSNYSFLYNQSIKSRFSL